MTVTVLLTQLQRDALRRYIPPQLAPVFEHDVVNAGSGRYTAHITAPFIAWQILVEEVHMRMTTRGGRREGDHTGFLQSLTARMATPVNRLLMHPALAGRAKAGNHMVDGAFPVWSQDEDRWGRIWWPAPNGGEFDLLKPTVWKANGLQLTSWSHLGVTARHWCHDPALHVAIAERAPLPELIPVAAPQRSPSPD